MKMLVSPLHNNNSLFTPSKIGFFASLLLHMCFVYLIIEKFQPTQVAQNGVHSITLALATIQTPSVQDTQPKPTPKPNKIQKQQPKPIPQKAHNPVPQEVVEQTSESMRAKEANDQSFGDVVQRTAKNDGEYNEIYDKIQSAITQKQEHPFMLRKRGIEGEVTVEFDVYVDGRVDNISVIRPSQYEAFNEASIKAVRDASKNFPRLQHNQGFTIVLKYNLVS
ncbi:TonB family protein [uncultured Helicobacter sp.]|uniref:TonB family protein n=1 Tax=uncultured Helicobacter sp. TaxID=175537 RepID=UPI001C3AF3D3|nr:energy transducer TonB [Candidatus Helicobacter avicola]